MFNGNGNSGRPLRVALYARVSTEDQAERETIQNQVQVVNTLCPAMGLEIVRSYLDDGISGMVSLEQRPEGARLLEDASHGNFKQVVVYRLDRIGRKALVILSAWEALKQRGVALRSLTEPFDTAQPFGEFVMGILAMVAGYERDSIVSRTTEGRRRKAREGCWTGGQAPLGYRVTDGRLEVDEEEASIVRRIFSMYTEDRMSAQGIATYLNANGVLTQAARRGFTSKRIKTPNHWDHSRVISILKNETYAGVRHVGKRGKGDIITQEVPPIIPRETWEAPQRLLRQNWAYAPRNAKRDYLLRGLIYCGLCGRRYVGFTTNSGKAAYYKCNRHECQAPKVRAELLEELVWKDIRRFAQDPGAVLEELSKQLAYATGDGLETELHQVEAALARIQEERQAILYRLRKRLITDEEGDNQLVATGQERDMLLARKETLEAQMRDKEGQRGRLTAAEALLRGLQERLDAADAKTKRDMIETLVGGVTVTPTEEATPQVAVTYLFEPPRAFADIASYRDVANIISLTHALILQPVPAYALSVGVHPQTASRWAKEGKVHALRGGDWWHVVAQDNWEGPDAIASPKVAQV